VIKDASRKPANQPEGGSNAEPAKGGPHIWVTTDPDTGKPAVVAAPVAAGTLSAKVQAKVVLLESALAEQIASKCCVSPVKR